MPTLKSEGVENLYKTMKQLELDSNKDLIRQMLKEGEKPVVKSWESNIKRVSMPRGTQKMYAHVKSKKSKNKKIYFFNMKSRATGQTANAVAGRVTLTKRGVGKDDVYPKGNTTGRNKNVRYAEIAFVLNYGKDGQSPTKFVDVAVSSCEDACVKEMEKVFEDYLKKNNLI